MSEIKFVELTCQRCGGELNEQYGEYVCTHCGKSWEEVALHDFRDMIDACEEAIRAQRVADIANLRQLLWEQTHKEYVSNFEVERLCHEIQKFLPRDFYANFFLATCSESKTELGDFLSGVDAKEHYEDVPLMLDYLLKGIKSEWTMGISNFIEKIKDFDLGMYHSYRTKFEEEYDKIEECTFEPAFPRDVFVAYSSRDMAKVCELVAALEEENLTCFVAARNLRHGSGSADNYEKMLYTAIEHCNVLVFVSSDNSRSVRCDAYKELEYVLKTDADKPRVEFLIKSYTGRATERYFVDFFAGRESCETAADVAARVTEIIMGTDPEPVPDPDPDTGTDPEPVPDTEPEPDPAENIETSSVKSSEVVKKLKRVRISLEAGDFDDAKQRLLRIISDEESRAGECEIAEVYHYKMLMDYGAHNDDHLVELLIKSKGLIINNKNYLLAKSYAEDSNDETELKALLLIKNKSEGAIGGGDGDNNGGDNVGVGGNNGNGGNTTPIIEEPPVNNPPTVPGSDIKTPELKDFEIKYGVLLKYKGDGGDVVIPENVTSIGEKAFKECDRLTSVVIPNSVTTISSNAFYKCNALTIVTIPAGVTSAESALFFVCEHLTYINVDSGNKNYKSIDGNLYTIDGKTLVQYAIGKQAETFTVPDGVTEIGSCAFYGCNSLRSVSLPDSVTKIGASAFASLVSLTEIDIPKKVTSIGEVAFCKCSSLKTIFIPKSVKTMGYRVFDSCKSLKTINCEAASIPEGWNKEWINSCNAEVLWGRKGSTSKRTITIQTRTTEPKPAPTDINDFEIKDGEIVRYKGSGGEVVIPDGITKIGVNAFIQCRTLTKVYIPEGVTAIGYKAFNKCAQLKSVNFPEGLVSIGESAFDDCDSLTEVNIPASVTAIDRLAFDDCDSLASINVDSGNKNYKSIDGNLYSADGKKFIQYAIGKKATSFVIPTGVTSVCTWSFDGSTSLKSIVLPNSVDFIGTYAFNNCTSLLEIIIPNGVETIDDGTFWNCRSLKRITIPGSVTSIGKNAFYGCSSLTSVTIPDGVTSVGKESFKNCSSLETVVLPRSIKFVGSSVFENCGNIMAIYCRIKKPMFSLPQGFDKEWIGKVGGEKVKVRVVWDYKG